MKTKHLFLATALMASFAACTNEEIVSDVQQNVAAGRPTVDNVKLTFGENVDSRLVYNKGYKWESTDVIGALLMDQPNSLPSAEGWADLEWAEKYSLTSSIHTSYPFTYNKEDKTWGCNAKMLEGNYFFAFPWESYDGNRQVSHSLIKQEQKGIGAEVRAESYANNQFFIGYDRIVAGTQAAEALNNVEMTPVLGAVQFQIVNTGTQDYHINKVVLEGNKLHSVLTFDPAAVKDASGNVTTPAFNTSNYLGYDFETAYIDDEDYDKEDALLAVVKPLASAYDGFSQLIITGTEEERVLEAGAGNTAYVLIMATPAEIKPANDDHLTLTIYTDEGVVAGIDLTKINKEINDDKGVSAVTSAKIKEIGPDVVNTIKVQIDDNSFNVPTYMGVYNDNDLLQFIQWNASEVGAREIYAELHKDVTLTAEMLEVLAENKSLELTITGAKEVTLDAELEADALDLENLTFAAVDEEVDGVDIDAAAPSIKVLGELVLTDKSDVVAKITVEEKAELTINNKKIKSVIVDNYGTLNIGAATKYLNNGTINNYGEMNIAEEAIVKATINNEAELNIDGKATVVANDEEGEITLGEEASLTLSSNAGIVYTEDGAKVSGNNQGEIKYEDGAKISVTNSGNGVVYREVSGAVSAEPTGAAATNVTAWYVVGDITLAADATIGKVVVDGNHDIEVAVPTTGTVTLTISGDLEINGSTTTEGAIKAGSITVKEDGIWTNNGTVVVTTKNGISNAKGEIENNGTVKMAAGTTANAVEDQNGNFTKFTAGEWDGEAATIEQVTVDTPSALENVVATWWSEASKDFNAYYNTYKALSNNPYDVETFVNKVLVPWTSTSPMTCATTLINSDNWNLTNPTAAELKAKLIANYTEFVAAIDEYVFGEEVVADTNTTLSTYKAKYVDVKLGTLINGYIGTMTQSDYMFNNSDAAIRELMGKMSNTGVNNPTTLAEYQAQLKIYKNFSIAEIKTALEKTACGASGSEFNGAYAYIWNECSLDKAVAVWKKYSGVADANAYGAVTQDLGVSFVAWANAMMANSAYADIKTALNTAGVNFENVGTFANYSDDQYSACAE